MRPEQLQLRDASLRELTAKVLDSVDGRVALDRSAFYPTGGDQPHDGGTRVRTTGEVGRVVVTKTESRGKAFKRIRIRVDDR